METKKVEEIQQINENVILLNGCNPGPFTLTGTNNYLLGKAEKRILVDAGQNIPKFKENLVKVLQDNKCQIDQLLITHHHFDHTNGIEQILEICGKDIKISKYSDETKDLEIQQKLGFKYNHIKQGDIIQGDGFSLQVHEFKGHCCDHLGFFIKEWETVLTGDFILGGSSAIVSDLKEQFDNFETALSFNASTLLPGKSLQKIYIKQTIYLSSMNLGHGIVIQGKQEVQQEIQKNKDNRLKRQQQVIDCLKLNDHEPKTIDHIFEFSYPEVTNEALVKFAKHNIQITLNKLASENNVGKIPDTDKHHLINKDL